MEDAIENVFTLMSRIWPYLEKNGLSSCIIGEIYSIKRGRKLVYELGIYGSVKEFNDRVAVIASTFSTRTITGQCFTFQSNIKEYENGTIIL